MVPYYYNLQHCSHKAQDFHSSDTWAAKMAIKNQHHHGNIILVYCSLHHTFTKELYKLCGGGVGPTSKWYVQGGRGGWRRMAIEQFPCVEQSLVGGVSG